MGTETPSIPTQPTASSPRTLKAWHGTADTLGGLSTVLYDFGVEAKTRQLILRHSNAQTIENVYTKRVDRKLTNAMQPLEQSLIDFSLSFPDCAPEKDASVQ